MEYDITFVSAESSFSWTEDFIFQIIKKWPVKIFNEDKPWDLVIVQQPFIHEFVPIEAKQILHDIRDEKSVSKQPLFPRDSLESEINFKEYIEQTPLRFMITGDERPFFFNIGETLSKKFNTNHITPEKLVAREIRKRTRIGKWINWNLNQGKGVPIYVVMKLLEAELKKSRYEQKGYIMTGFPILPDLTTDSPCEYRDDEDYDIKYSCAYVEHIARYMGEEELEEDREDAVSVSSAQSSELSTSENNEGVLNVIRNQKFTLEVDDDEDEILRDSFQRQLNFLNDMWCHPKFVAFLGTENYTDQFSAVIKVLERFVLLCPCQNILRMDFRLGPQALIDDVWRRFSYIHYKVNYEPIKFNTIANINMSLKDLCGTQTIFPHCKWWTSPFKTMCPVNLYYGRRRFCDSRFSVRYLKYIFLCYSSDDRNKFIAHANKYLNRLPTCRAAVIGPHRSGKTTLSKYLANFFKADIYNEHIEKAQEGLTTDKGKYLEKEYKVLEALRLKSFVMLKKAKVDEWNSCVISNMNEILGEKLFRRRFEIFSTRNADKYFESTHKRVVSDIGIKKLILENAIYNTSISNITSNDFIEWSTIEPQPPHQYRQYVLDSAPLSMNFWEELLISDALPDCVFFLKSSSFKKMTDIYSMRHDELHCIDHNFIFDEICRHFNSWKQFFGQENPVKNVTAKRMDDSTKEYINLWIEIRHREAESFVAEYEELQLFLQEHDVICVEVDLSQKSWTRSIIEALVKHLSVYEDQAKPLYENLFGASSSLENEEQPLSRSSSFNNEYFDKERDTITESDISVRKSVNFGYCRDWCPVLLNDSNVLFKGNMRYSAEYKNKVYAMSSDNALAKFLSNPLKYSRNKQSVPPPRIYIAGLAHRNKMKMAESLANQLKVEFVSHSKFSSFFIDDTSIKSLREDYLKTKEKFLREIKERYEYGLVCFGFPLILEQFHDTIDHNLHPECVIIFEDHQEVENTMVRFYSRLSAQNSQKRQSIAWNGFDGLSTTSEQGSIPISLKLTSAEKCRQMLDPFLVEKQRIEDACIKLRIPVIKVPKNYKRMGLVDYYVEQINHHRKRRAIFEEVQEITMEESEVFLDTGYYRFSRFKRSCPVHVSRLITLNHFEGMRSQGCIYPCIYRDFIYFICGKNNLNEFKRDPLEFVNTCNPPQMQDPMRVAVYGPSKSGVSTICQTIARELGFRIISPKDFPEGTTNRSVIDFCKMYRSTTPNGIVMDNIPLTSKFLLEAAQCTVDIAVIFVVITTIDKVLYNWYAERRNLKDCPSVSLMKFCQEFCETQKSIKDMRECSSTSLFNIHYLNGYVNSWTIWEKVYKELLKTTRSIQGYRIKLLKNRPASLANLNLFYDAVVFQREINHYYCQVCLLDGKLNVFKYYHVNVGPEFYSAECQKLLNRPYGYLDEEIYSKFNFSKPFDLNDYREPLTTQRRFFMSTFQFKDKIYWSCDIHTLNFMTSTRMYHEKSDQLKPLYIPFLVIGYTKDFMAFQGFCPVEYSRQKRVKGAIDLAVYYRKRVYLLANKENAIEFLSYPEKYRCLVFDPRLYLDYPNVSFHGLQQDAISNVLLDLTYARPKHFGLNGAQSAATFVGIKLKSTASSDKYTDFWNGVLRNYIKDSKQLAIELKKHRNNINPYIAFE